MLLNPWAATSIIVHISVDLKPKTALCCSWRLAAPAPQENMDTALAKQSSTESVDFRTEPSRYRHWKLSIEGRIATLLMDVQEDAGIRPGYKLKLNSYDLGVDIALLDGLQRI